MKELLENRSRFMLVVVTTLLSIVATLIILYIGYSLMGVKVRNSELAIGILAPLVIASIVTWYLYGIIKRLKFLEEELRSRITKEKEEVYLATIYGAQHVINNLLHGLTLVKLEIKKHPAFDKRRERLFHDMLSESERLMKDLSSVGAIDPEAIKKSGSLVFAGIGNYMIIMQIIHILLSRS